MFELIRGAMSSLVPSPPRPGIYTPEGTLADLAPAGSEVELESSEPSLPEPPRLLEPEPDLPAEPLESEPQSAVTESNAALEEELPLLPPHEPAAVGTPIDLQAALQFTFAEPPPAPGPLRVSVSHPRCPYCHEEILPGARQEACKVCRAWHHEACWREGRSRCSACRASAPIQVRPGPPPPPASAGVDSDLATSWTLVATGSLAYSLVLIVLRELYSTNSESLGYALSNAWSAIPGLLAMTCLFVASGLRPGPWRTRFHRAAWAIVLLTFLVGLYALAFEPPGPVYDGFSFRPF